MWACANYVDVYVNVYICGDVHPLFVLTCTRLPNTQTSSIHSTSQCNFRVLNLASNERQLLVQTTSIRLEVSNHNMICSNLASPAKIVGQL